MYWNLCEAELGQVILHGWIVTLDVLKYRLRTGYWGNGWIVTLDVLKLRSNGSIEDTKESWIVTLDVLK